MKKKVVTIILSVISIPLFLMIFIFLYDSVRQPFLFDKHSFISKQYSVEQIKLFADIAFREGNKLRKWEKDIRVELDTTCSRDSAYIKLTDQIITVLSPLIKPIKISRVSTNGNLIIYGNLNETPAKRGIGYTLVNNMSLISEPITHANVYITKHSLSILTHEICHAIGLSHPEDHYPFYNIMGINEFYVKDFIDDTIKVPPSKNALVFNTLEEMDLFIKKHIISTQEMDVIKMMYSGYVKIGLKRSYFKKEMNLDIAK